MKTIFTILIFIMFSGSTLVAHSLFLYVDDNEDGTISIEGAASNDASLEASPILFVSGEKPGKNSELFAGKVVIFKTVLDSTGCVNAVKPARKRYTIILNGGDGHVVSAKGVALAAGETGDWKKAIQKMPDNKWKKLLKKR